MDRGEQDVSGVSGVAGGRPGHGVGDQGAQRVLHPPVPLGSQRSGGGDFPCADEVAVLQLESEHRVEERDDPLP